MSLTNDKGRGRTLTLSPSVTAEERKALGWSHVRLNVVVPIGVIVALAIVCVVLAVLSSAKRADEVALDNERQLFTRSLAHHAERVLREVEGIATSEASVRNIRQHFDSSWVQNRLGMRLQTLFDQDFVFVADASDQFIYALLGNRSVDPNWFNSIKPDLIRTFHFV
jgi:diguanylate cyclase